jgi:predicted AAA+ superfamily ATPase
MDKLQVIDLKRKKTYKPPKAPHPDVLQPHFACVICGPRQSGKSLMTRNLLERDDMLKGVFKKPNYVIIMSTSLANGDYDLVTGPNIYKYDDYNANIINHVIETQKNLIEKYGRNKVPEILIILDDILDTGALQRHSMIEKLFSKGRHYNINVIVISQQINRVSKLMRLNSDYFCLFRPFNINETEDFLSQYIQKKYHKKFMNYLEKVWNDDPHAFILIDNKSKDSDRKFRLGFSENIILKELV